MLATRKPLKEATLLEYNAQVRQLRALKGQALLTAKLLRNMANKIKFDGAISADQSLNLLILLHDHADDLEKAARNG